MKINLVFTSLDNSTSTWKAGEIRVSTRDVCFVRRVGRVDKEKEEEGLKQWQPMLLPLVAALPIELLRSSFLRAINHRGGFVQF